MVKYTRTENGDQPAVFICDHCQKRIEDSELGAAVPTKAQLQPGEFCDVAHAHKGECHDALERKYSEPGAYVGWDELSQHIAELAINSKLRPPKAEQMTAALNAQWAE